ncbi:hypothetical protein Nepgr_017136 [Nepenthes gracilis]|uniref:Uncharacterized protein n=1 Tax=Nepenthes gracilis TaxID=150966 RepID=A0AAD3SR12_NEPGR|nr:hypothetical protein Nepgr_017136 [Nepenthes gracilis]
MERDSPDEGDLCNAGENIEIANQLQTIKRNHQSLLYEAELEATLMEMSLVSSTDGKPRLKWTSGLHQRFIEAVNQLGGADKATPKSLMRLMEIPGLTLYHLKSHLQKYRLGKNQRSETGMDSKRADYKENASSVDPFDGGRSDTANNQINESLQISQAVQEQMEVQRKIHEQIEVQRHLQLRIEAQGKYLQKVLKKAQETLSGYNSSPLVVEHAKAELSRLVSMVSCQCPNSKLSELKNAIASNMKNSCSMESSLTSSESYGEKGRKIENRSTDSKTQIPVVLPLLDPAWMSSSTDHTTCGKRSRRTFSDTNSDEQLAIQRSSNYQEIGVTDSFDLNSQYQNGLDSGPNTIDLNS